MQFVFGHLQSQLIQKLSFIKNLGVTTVLVFSVSVRILAQISSEELRGDWIENGSKFDLSVGSGYHDIFSISYLRMSFRDNQVSISYNPIEQRHLNIPYSILGDTLVYGKTRSKLEFYGSNRMSLTQKNETTPIHFTKILSLVSDGLSSDSIFDASILLCPRYNGNITSLLFDAGFIDFPAGKNDRSIMVEFTLLKDGSMSNLKVESNHAPWRNHLFKKAILKSRLNWWIPTINNKPTSTHIKFTVVRLGGKSIHDRHIADLNFNQAMEIIKTNPDGAIIKLTKSIAHQPSNAKYYFYRALAYYYTLNTDLMCQNIVLAKSFCPFLPLGFVDEKERIQVQCFTD